jgi:hypothetical protein
MCSFVLQIGAIGDLTGLRGSTGCRPLQGVAGG